MFKVRGGMKGRVPSIGWMYKYVHGAVGAPVAVVAICARAAVDALALVAVRQARLSLVPVVELPGGAAVAALLARSGTTRVRIRARAADRAHLARCFQYTSYTTRLI